MDNRRDLIWIFLLVFIIISLFSGFDMMGYMHGIPLSGFGFFGMGFMLFFWILIIFLVIYFIAEFPKPRRKTESSLEILKKRLARGEITMGEYIKLKEEIHQ